MRNPLSKRIPRDLRKNLVKYMGMVIILVCTISIGSSFQSTLIGAEAYLDKIEDGNLQEDGFFETSEQISEEMSEHFLEEGVLVEKNFYATENEFADSSKIVIFDERTDIDIPTVFEGRLPASDDEIVLDHVFARAREISIGDTISLLDKAYVISGTVSFPDYSSLFMNNTDLVMNTTHFCVAMVNNNAFDEIPEKNLTYRYSYRFEDRELKKSQKVSKSEDMQKYLVANGNHIQSFIRKDQNQSISFLEMDIGKDGPFMTVFVYILIAMIAFVFAILTNNTIEHDSVIIGTLLASGYKKSEIIWHYLQPTLIIAVTGSVIGNILGYTVMIEPFLNIYYSTYSIGPIQISFDYATFVMTTVLPVVIMLGINYFMLAHKLALTPLNFLRRELKKGKQQKAVRLPNFNFLNRFRLRVIIQNRGSYCMLFLGIFLASFLLMFGIGLKPLMENYTDNIDKSLSYNYQYILKAPVETEVGEKIFMYEMDTWFPLGGKDIGVTCYGIDKDSKYFKDAYTMDGVSISSALAQKMKLDVGDTLLLKDANKDREYEFDITKIYSYDAALAMFVERGQLTELLDVEKDSYNCIVSEEKPDIDERYVAKRVTREDMLGAADQMMESFETVILFINVFSVVVYLVIMYVLTKVVIDKNALSISYMKVFGYEQKEIRKLYLTATTIVVLASLIICIPVEVALFKGVLVFLSSMIEGYVAFYLPGSVYIKIILIGIVSYMCINAIHVRGIKRIPMTEALKNRE